MSEQTIARWNAIALERPATSEPTNLKRARPDDDEDEDDVSLVSRSPSPVLDDSMDVDEVIHKYDQYVRRPTPEVITVNTKIKPTNKGFALLSKLGWVEGQPIGLSPDGRTEPIPFSVKADLTGLGKTTQDFEMIETTVSQRRGMDSERQQKETEEQRKSREDAVARKSALQSEISSTLRAFYCELCDKQFKTVAQYDEHTNSYAHHHKARFQDMQANARLKSKEDADQRKEKERKREEKELRKIAAANGIKMPKPSAVSSLSAPLGPASDGADASTSMDIDGTPIEPKKSGWASISSAPAGSGSSSGGFKKSGWATVGSAPSSRSLPPSSAVTTPVTHTGAHARFLPSGSSGSSSGDQHAGHPSHTTTFRNAGWTSLDTGSSQPPPPAAVTSSINANDTHHLPSVSSSQGSWSPVATSSAILGSSADSSRKWASTSFSTVADPLPFPPSETLPQPPPPAPPTSLPPVPPKAKPVRSNWQQFQKGIGRRK